jgi:hypothetical protein
MTATGSAHDWDECFDINPGFGTPTAEAWLADILRLASR